MKPVKNSLRIVPFDVGDVIISTLRNTKATFIGLVLCNEPACSGCMSYQYRLVIEEEGYRGRQIKCYGSGEKRYWIRA